MNSPSSEVSQADLIKWLVDSSALRFGEFNTKSARATPYFIDTAKLYYSQAWSAMITSYVKCAYNHFGAKLTAVYGHAYKGIPLCASFALIWYQLTGQSISFMFNRKETKTHGEKGKILSPSFLSSHCPDPTSARHPGYPGLVICDDVLTSGQSLREAITVLSSYQKTPSSSQSPHVNPTILGAIVLVDRQEQSSTHPTMSAKQAIEHEYNIPVISLINLDEIIAELTAYTDPKTQAHLQAIKAYQHSYGISH